MPTWQVRLGSAQPIGNCHVVEKPFNGQPMGQWSAAQPTGDRQLASQYFNARNVEPGNGALNGDTC